MSTVAILLAGGSGSRLQHRDNKVFVPVGGRPLLAWSLRAFARAAAVTSLVVVTREGDDDQVAAVVADQALGLPLRMTTGGATRHASEHAGLEAVAAEIVDGTIDVVLIHDAARPFASSELVDRVAVEAREVGGAVPVIPLGDGIYRIADDHLRTPAPDLQRVQTPQGFRAPELLDAYRRAARDGFAGVDTSETVERYAELSIAALPGDPANIKITVPDDLRAARDIAVARQRGAG